MSASLAQYKAESSCLLEVVIPSSWNGGLLCSLDILVPVQAFEALILTQIGAKPLRPEACSSYSTLFDFQLLRALKSCIPVIIVLDAFGMIMRDRLMKSAAEITCAFQAASLSCRQRCLFSAVHCNHIQMSFLVCGDIRQYRKD